MNLTRIVLTLVSDPAVASIITTVIGTLGTITVFLIKLKIESNKRGKKEDSMLEETKREREKIYEKMDGLKIDTKELQKQITSNHGSLELKYLKM